MTEMKSYDEPSSYKYAELYNLHNNVKAAWNETDCEMCPMLLESPQLSESFSSWSSQGQNYSELFICPGMSLDQPVNKHYHNDMFTSDVGPTGQLPFMGSSVLLGPTVTMSSSVLCGQPVLPGPPVTMGSPVCRPTWAVGPACDNELICVVGPTCAAKPTRDYRLTCVVGPTCAVGFTCDYGLISVVGGNLCSWAYLWLWAHLCCQANLYCWYQTCLCLPLHCLSHLCTMLIIIIWLIKWQVV